MNYTNIIRPSKDEIDALEELGNEGWNWNSLLRCMKKVKDFGPSHDYIKLIMQSETLQRSELSTTHAYKYAAEPDPELHGADGTISAIQWC